jgi:hypothetical protein
MKKPHRIHSLDTLEKEIYRNELLAKEQAAKLEKDLDLLKNDFFDLARNSMKSKKEEKGSSFTERLFRNEHVRETVDGITSRITDHAAEAINGLIDRLFHKHK